MVVTWENKCEFNHDLPVYYKTVSQINDVKIRYLSDVTKAFDGEPKRRKTLGGIGKAVEETHEMTMTDNTVV